MSPETAYALTAHFTALSLTSTVSDGTVYTGGRITLTPNIDGGTWTFDSNYFSADGNTFTAMKAGTSAITYTVGQASTTYTVTIRQSEIPQTGQDFTPVSMLACAAVVCIAGPVIILQKKKREN